MWLSPSASRNSPPSITNHVSGARNALHSQAVRLIVLTWNSRVDVVEKLTNGANENPMIISPPSMTSRSPIGGSCGAEAGSSGGGGGGVAVVGGARTGGGGGSRSGADWGAVDSGVGAVMAQTLEHRLFPRRPLRSALSEQALVHHPLEPRQQSGVLRH